MSISESTPESHFLVTGQLGWEERKNTLMVQVDSVKQVTELLLSERRRGRHLNAGVSVVLSEGEEGKGWDPSLSAKKKNTEQASEKIWG